MVPHMDQSGLKEGEKRFIISLRSTGEGHISSVSFQTGIVNKIGNIMLDEPAKYSTCSKKDRDKLKSLKNKKLYSSIRQVLNDLLTWHETKDL